MNLTLKATKIARLGIDKGRHRSLPFSEHFAELWSKRKYYRTLSNERLGNKSLEEGHDGRPELGMEVFRKDPRRICKVPDL